MSRAEKRLAAKQAKQKINRSVTRYVTNFQLLFETFDSIERLFIALKNGELRWDKDGWCIMGLGGFDIHVLSALEGWILYWQTLADHLEAKYDDAPLRKLAKSLEYEKPMRIEEVEAAYGIIQLQRALYRVIPKSVTTKVCHQVQDAIRRDDEIKELIKQ